MNGEVVEIRNQHGYPVHVRVRSQKSPEARKPDGFTGFLLFTMGLAFAAGCVFTYVVIELWN